MQDIVYGCALREEFMKLPFADEPLDGEKIYQASNKIYMKVIPELTVLHAMLRIRDIDDRKQADIEHEADMKQRMLKYHPEPTEEEKEEMLKMTQTNMNMTMKSQQTKKKGKEKEIDPEELERQRKEAEY